MDVARVSGLDIAYRRAGSGPPLVLVHGGGEDHASWIHQLRALSEEFDVIAWDEPGAGGSAVPPEALGLAGFADCLAGLIRALGVGPACVCGFSWGSTVVLELFRRHRHTVARLVLTGAYAGWRGSLPAREADARLRAAGASPSAVAMAAADLRDVLPSIDAPTLLIWGERDDRSPPPVARAFRDAIDHAEFIRIADAGHASHQDAPAAFNAAVRAFCRA